jgi:hypothetical protein
MNDGHEPLLLPDNMDAARTKLEASIDHFA